MTPVSIKTEDMNDYVIMHLAGDFASIDDSEKIRNIFKVLADEGKQNVLINLKDVFYLNSATLSAFLSGSSIMNKVSGRIVLYNPSDYLQNIFPEESLSDSYIPT